MEKYKKVRDLFLEKIKTIMREYPAAFPEVPACADGRYFSVENCKNAKGFLDIMNWTTSFFTGMALLAYETVNDCNYLKWVNSKNVLYHDKVFRYGEDTMHDLGFLYSLHSVALYKITGDTYSKKTALKAADELAKRFVSNGGYIKAWGRMDNTIPDYSTEEDAKCHFYTESMGLAIIDCMMNLPLMYWAWRETGNDFYRDIADCHAKATSEYFVRGDGSVYHSYRFDTENGAPLGGCNYCGYGDESWWARGTAWAVYGFAIAYSYTGNKEYIDLSVRLAKSFISQITENDPIPAWDFRLPAGEKPSKDTSAAVIACSGFFEIIKHVKEQKIEEFAYLILDTVVEKYTNFDISIPGVLKEQNGCGVYTSFGDYFYFEAICKALKIKEDMYW